jgi:hypothetical protein
MLRVPARPAGAVLALPEVVSWLRRGCCALLLGVWLPGCAPAVRPAPPATSEVSGAGPSALQRSMRRSYDEARALEIALLFGRLEEVRTHALALAGLAPNAHLRGGALRTLRARAEQIAAAPGAETTLPSFAELAVGCGSCHAEMRRTIRPRESAREPVDDGTLPARMARHQWAAERLFDGLIGPSEASWRTGLELLAQAPLPLDAVSEDPGVQARGARFAARLSEMAFETASAPADPSGRTYRYVRVLEACVGCHALTTRE